MGRETGRETDKKKKGRRRRRAGKIGIEGIGIELNPLNNCCSSRIYNGPKVFLRNCWNNPR